MELIHIVTWVWGSKYGPHYAERLERAIGKHLGLEHRFHVCAPVEGDEYLTEIPGCFARLRAFDPKWQAAQGILPGERIVNLDLDLVVTGRLDAVFDRDEPFAILQGVNAANPCRYNGSVWMLRAGYRPDVWTDFTFDRAEAVRVAEFADDQRWFEVMMPDAAPLGPQDGVYGFGKPGWPKGTALPGNAKLVAFFGWRDPAKFLHVDWVRKHWA